MGATPTYALPYPEPSDPADVPTDIHELATALDGLILGKTIADAKGDILAATGPDTLARVAVGATDQVLTADPSAAAGVAWKTPAAGGGGGSAAQAFDLRNPQIGANAGNVFPNVVALTAYESWHWEFVKDVDGRLYGLVRVLAATTAAKIVLATRYNAAAGVARWSVASAAHADGASTNPGSLTAIAAQDVTVPGTARNRKDVSFTLAAQPTVGDLLAVSIYHEGAHANDTVAVNSELLGAWLLPT